MNILVFSWRGPRHPHAGGAEYVTQKHAKAWVKAGHDVTLFTSHFRGAKIKETIDDVQVIRKGSEVFGVQIAAFTWYLVGKHKQFDLVIDQFHGIPFFTPLYVRTRKLAFIHEVAKEVWKYNPWPKPFNLLPYIVGTFFEPFIFKVIYKKIQFMTVSESTKDDLSGWSIPKRNITVIHNGMDSTYALKKMPEKSIKKTVTYLGALSEDKGVFDTVYAFSEIIRKDEDWQLWIVGKSSVDIDRRLKELVNNLNIKNKVKLWGFVSDKRKFELLAQSSYLINPSIREGWGLVNIEANSVGVPVIGYNVPGMRDSVIDGKTGVLVESGNYRLIAENVLKLFKDQSVYETYSANCRKWAAKFSWEKSTKESLDLIESL